MCARVRANGLVASGLRYAADADDATTFVVWSMKGSHAGGQLGGGDRAAKAHGKWLSAVTAAAKQARRAWIPEVRSAVDTQGLVAAVSAADLAVILHEDAVRPFRRIVEGWRDAGQPLDGGPKEILLIVGPEGGISSREVTKLCGAGAVTALLGPHVLRSSTAGPAAVVVASDVLGRW